MSEARHLSAEELQAGLPDIRASPKARGVLALIVRRPAVNERESLPEARLDLAEGLVGDSWRARGSRSTSDGGAHPDMQLNVMNARTIALLAVTPERWALAGDQLFIDLDLSVENLPVGARLALGEAVIEITAPPHTGCAKFLERFGRAAMEFVNSSIGRGLRLRGLNAKVVQPGVIRVGDSVTKFAPVSPTPG